MKENSKWISSAGSACGRVMTSSLFAPAILVSIVVWEFGTLLLEASRKPLWYDELLTFHVSALHPFSLLWKALRAGADGMPPCYYVIVRLARMLPGDPHVTLRVPSIFGYILTLLGVYWFTRKRLPAIAGLTAVLLVTLSPFRSLATEARSYPLLVGFLAISAVLWQRIDERRFMTPFLAIFLTLAVSCHHLAVIGLSCFGMAELTWTLRSRRIRWGVWAACLVATGPFFLSLPILLTDRNIFGKNFWSRPKWYSLASTYQYLGLDFNLALVLVVLLGIVLGTSLLRMSRRPGDGASENYFRPHEVVLVGGFLFYPDLLVVLAKLLNSGYFYRYGWPAIFGLVLGCVYLVRSSWATSTPLLVALLIAFGVQGPKDFHTLPKAGSTTVEERWTQLNALRRDEPTIPVVIGDPMSYLEAVQYSPRELRDRLVDVVDPDRAARLVGSDTCDKTVLLLAQFVPLQVDGSAPFEAAYQRFILYSGGAFDWFTQYLLEKNYHLMLVSKDGDSSIYVVER